MKISQNTSDILMLDDQPWLIGLMMGGLALLFAGIGVAMLLDGLLNGIIMLAIGGLIGFAMYRLIERTQIVFNRPEGRVEFCKQSMHRLSERNYALQDVRAATVETKKLSGNTRKRASRVVLVITNANGEQNVPLTNSLSTGDAAKRIAPVINTWLNLK